MVGFTRAALASACLLVSCTSVLAADYGKTAGSFDVSPSGAATYTIPIWTPPGPNGLTPTISLNYSSQADNGLAGVGWNLSAAARISRCERTRHQDGNAGGIELSNNDRFCIGGNRMRLISGTYGAQDPFTTRRLPTIHESPPTERRAMDPSISSWRQKAG